VWFSFIDLDDLKEIKLRTVEAPDPRAFPFNKVAVSHGVGTFRGSMQSFFIGHAGNALQSRASASSDLFAVWTWPASLVSVRKKGADYVARLVSLNNIHTNQPPFLPGPDGRSVLLRSKMVLDQYGGQITAADPKQGNVLVLPTADPAFTLQVEQGQRTVPQRGQPSASVSLVLPTGMELLTIDAGQELGPNWSWFNNNQERLTADKRLTFDATGQRLLVIPPENDRIVSRKLDVDGALNRLDGAPVVTSPTLLWATPGQEFKHRIKVQSKTGGLKFRLSGNTAPPALTVSDDGIVTWKVPSKWERSEATAVVSIRDASGQETQSVLKIVVR
jgi:hypothetical protein